MKSIIALENMEFYAFHGCFEAEKIVGTHFRVDVEMEVNTEKAQKSDHLTDTLDYTAVYADIKAEMQISVNLLEHLANRILGKLHQNHPSIQACKLTIRKCNPPIGERIEAVKFCLEQTFY